MGKTSEKFTENRKTSTLTEENKQKKKIAELKIVDSKSRPAIFAMRTSRKYLFFSVFQREKKRVLNARTGPNILEEINVIKKYVQTLITSIVLT